VRYVRGATIECGCWYHARDKFEDALPGAPVEAAEGIAWIRALFDVEDAADDAGRFQGQTDHAIPKSLDGNNTIDNAQHTCADCNVRKGTQTTEEFLGQ
jgi:hypothetical protein